MFKWISTLQFRHFVRNDKNLPRTENCSKSKGFSFSLDHLPAHLTRNTSFDCTELFFARKTTPARHFINTLMCIVTMNTSLEWWAQPTISSTLSTLVAASLLTYYVCHSGNSKNKFSLLLHNRHHFQWLWLVLVWNVKCHSKWQRIKPNNADDGTAQSTQHVGWRWIKIERWEENANPTRNEKNEKGEKEPKSTWSERKNATQTQTFTPTTTIIIK